jgi:mRNA interferase RelE/StbE
MYQVELRRKAVKDLSNVPKEYARLIAHHIDGLSENPRLPDAKKLKGGVGCSLRVGVYRVLYDIDDAERKITIFRIKHRREAYR